MKGNITPSPFSEESYQNQGLDQLVVYCVKRILDAGEECTFERLVYECFTLFPRKFSLERYPQWPDSARVNKAWLRCRTDRKWIVGSVKSGFVTTPSGKHIAEMVEKVLLGLKQKDKSKKISTKARERWSAVLNRIKKHPSFVRFCDKNNLAELTQEEIRDVLQATLETPLRIVKQNLAYLKDIANEYKDSEISAFLEICEQYLCAEPVNDEQKK